MKNESKSDSKTIQKSNKKSNPSNIDFSSIWAPSWSPRWLQNRWKIDPKSKSKNQWMLESILDRFWSILPSNLRPKRRSANQGFRSYVGSWGQDGPRALQEGLRDRFWSDFRWYLGTKSPPRRSPEPFWERFLMIFDVFSMIVWSSWASLVLIFSTMNHDDHNETYVSNEYYCAIRIIWTICEPWFDNCFWELSRNITSNQFLSLIHISEPTRPY